MWNGHNIQKLDDLLNHDWQIYLVILYYAIVSYTIYSYTILYYS